MVTFYQKCNLFPKGWILLLKRHLIGWTKKDTYIHIPNEIFDDLRKNIKSSAHRAFAYCYHYLITYLYRYGKYGLDHKFTQQAIKEFLGYNGDNKRLDYIIKKDGILDIMGYTETTSNYPVQVIFDDALYFTKFKDYKHDNYEELKILGYNNIRNFRIKYPVKGFYRNEDSYVIENMDGTFYDIKDTHGIDTEAFVVAMEDEEIGVMGFYVYAFVKSKIGNEGGKFHTGSNEEMSTELGISNKTLIKYTEILEKKKFLKVYRQDYFNNPEGLATTYRLPTVSQKGSKE